MSVLNVSIENSVSLKCNKQKNNKTINFQSLHPLLPTSKDGFANILFWTKFEYI